MSTASTAAGTATTCDPATAVTRSLLGYGIVAGPFYVIVSLAQALTKEGFDLSRHAWSLMANGPYGWVQILNLILTGAMTVAFAVGLGRALRPGRASVWAPRLVAVYGLSLVVAGVFRADPALGFPSGTPADAREVSWHGLVHLAAGAVGFLSLVVACLILASRFSADGQLGWAALTRVVGIGFLGAFVGIASGAGSVATTLVFVAAVIMVCGWMSAVSVHLYRRLSA